MCKQTQIARKSTIFEKIHITIWTPIKFLFTLNILYYFLFTIAPCLKIRGTCLNLLKFCNSGLGKKYISVCVYVCVYVFVCLFVCLSLWMCVLLLNRALFTQCRDLFFLKRFKVTDFMSFSSDFSNLA